MNPPQEFWDWQKGMVLATTNGTLRFTGAGKSRYAARLARHGFTLARVTTMERLYDVMRQVIRSELDADNRAFDNHFDDPNVHEAEQDLILSVRCEGLLEMAVVFNADLPTTGEEDLHT